MIVNLNSGRANYDIKVQHVGPHAMETPLI